VCLRMSNGEEDPPKTPSPLLYDLGVPFEQLDPVKFLFFATLLFFTEAALYYPVDVLRTRLQVQRQHFSIWNFIPHLKELGPRGWFRGFIASSSGAPSYGLYFVTYNYFKDKFQHINDQSTPNLEHRAAMWAVTSAALIADLVYCVFACPTEVVVQRLQISGIGEARQSSGYHTTRQIWRESGIRGFYKGFGALLLTYIPGSLAWWVSYEHFKEVFSKQIALYQQKQTSDRVFVVHQNYLAQLLGGFIAGLVTVIVTNPFDVIKTRLQTQDAQFASQSGNKYSNTWQAIRSISKNEGLGAFGKGVVPRLIVASFYSPIASLCYELVLQLSKKDTQIASFFSSFP